MHRKYCIQLQLEAGATARHPEHQRTFLHIPGLTIPSLQKGRPVIFYGRMSLLEMWRYVARNTEAWAMAGRTGGAGIGGFLTERGRKGGGGTPPANGPLPHLALHPVVHGRRHQGHAVPVRRSGRGSQVASGRCVGAILVMGAAFSAGARRKGSLRGTDHSP